MCPENTNTKNNIIFKIYVHNNKILVFYRQLLYYEENNLQNSFSESSFVIKFL